MWINDDRSLSITRDEGVQVGRYRQTRDYSTFNFVSNFQAPMHYNLYGSGYGS